MQLNAPGQVKGLWSKEEDERILACVSQGITKWAEICRHIPGRNGKQCRERYENHLKPSLKKGHWEEAELQLLIRLHEVHGNRWSRIARELPGRYHVSI